MGRIMGRSALPPGAHQSATGHEQIAPGAAPLGTGLENGGAARGLSIRAQIDDIGTDGTAHRHGIPIEIGRRALIELVGYWHPDYLERKIAKVRAAKRRDLILLVYEGVNVSREKWQDAPSEVLYFKTKPVLKDVMATVEKVAV